MGKSVAVAVLDGGLSSGKGNSTLAVEVEVMGETAVSRIHHSVSYHKQLCHNQDWLDRQWNKLPI